MKKVGLVYIVIMFSQLSLWSQDNLWNDRESIIQEYENYPDTNFQYFILNNTDELLVKIYGQDSIEITHYFKPDNYDEMDNESICDSIVIELLCETCVDYHITQMSESKYRKWVKVSDSVYISSKWVSKFWPSDKSPNIYTVPIMRVIKGDDLTRILLYTDEFTKKEWKAIRKGTTTSYSSP